MLDDRIHEMRRSDREAGDSASVDLGLFEHASHGGLDPIGDVWTRCWRLLLC